MSDMRTKLPANVTRERNRHGTVVYYHRVGKGKRTRLPDFGSDDFEPAYQAARQGKPLPRSKSIRGAEGTLAWLVTEYKKTAHFRGLDQITQRRRDSFYRQMVEESGEASIADIVEQDIVDSVEERATVGKGHGANNFLKAVKPLFAYAKRRGWIETDPAKNVAAAQVIAGGHEPWTIDEVKRYEQCHPVGTMANLALRILLFTGLRRSDAVLLGRQHIRKGVVRFTPGKTKGTSGVEVIFTALPPLLEAIAATKSDNLTFLVTERGHPFASGNSFANKFKDWCKLAGVSKTAHGLRKLGPSIAADNSATANELMAMWGWSTLEQAQLYTKSADRQRMGEAAAAKLQAGYDELIGNNTPRTFDAGAGKEQNIK